MAKFKFKALLGLSGNVRMGGGGKGGGGKGGGARDIPGNPGMLREMVEAVLDMF